MDKEKTNERENVANKSKSEGSLNIDAQYPELRRSSRSPVKPRRYEPEDLNSSVRNKNKLKAKIKTTRGCFESETKSAKFVTKSSEGINLKEESRLRRSKRSPKKPYHFQPEYIKSASKIKKKQGAKASPPTNVNRDGCVPTTECDAKSERKEEKDDVNQCKNKSAGSPLIKNSKLKKSALKITKKYKKNNSRTIKQIVYPTAEELAEYKRTEREQIKANRKMKEIFANFQKEPEKVKILSLNNMSSEEILNTFPIYQDQLDIVFHELRSQPKVDDYKGVNHYSVIELIDNEKQLKMMHKLGEVYETEPDGISLYPTLFANALMPEWLVHIFKDKYKLSHSEAVSHLHKQRQYMQYLDVDDCL
ncbi:uncharacterized protein LOC128924117 [Zeugodacus cucurbitae]|uniref:uncharacterized protein LOC128924117 n=1 Tax=Zeugodacus cucurbitae TaxID=28588 RepID=UPI0023D94BE0|nr:uncharacterized protein LOC128924117 [Zeugodacus cucurbitae]